MKEQGRSALFLAAAILAGCGSSNKTTIVPPVAPDLTGNWQIQSSTISSPTTPVGIVLFGALQSTGSQVAGTFRFTNLAQPSACGLSQVVSLSGSIDSNNNLTLVSSTLPNGTTIKANLAIDTALLPYFGSGTIEVDGTNCTFASSPGLGQQVANASGTFTGTLSPGALGTTGSGPTGTASLVINQSTSPSSDGQFSTSGSLSYSFGSCSGTASLSGTISGVGVILSSTSGSPTNLQVVSFIGTVTPAAGAITAGALEFIPAPCSSAPTSSAVYSGQMNRH